MVCWCVTVKTVYCLRYCLNSELSQTIKDKHVLNDTSSVFMIPRKSYQTKSMMGNRLKGFLCSPHIRTHSSEVHTEIQGGEEKD